MRGACCLVRPSVLVGVRAGRLSGDSRQAATLWLACHDTDAANSEAAQKLVAEADVNFPSVFVQPLAEVLSHTSSDVRQAAANTMATGIRVRVLRLSVLCCLPFQFPCASSQGSQSCGWHVSCRRCAQEPLLLSLWVPEADVVQISAEVP